MLNQCRFIVGPTSETVGQYQVGIGLMCRVSWGGAVGTRSTIAPSHFTQEVFIPTFHAHTHISDRKHNWLIWHIDRIGIKWSYLKLRKMADTHPFILRWRYGDRQLSGSRNSPAIPAGGSTTWEPATRGRLPEAPRGSEFTPWVNQRPHPMQMRRGHGWWHVDKRRRKKTRALKNPSA